MAYLLIPLLCVLATLKITLQSKFSKTAKIGISDNVFFNGIMFSTVALLFWPVILKNGVTYSTCIHGIIMGILSVAFQIFYLCAFSKGKMTLTVIINNFSMLLPMTVSVALFNEKFGILKITGTILALISFIFSVRKEKNSADFEASAKSNFQWFIFTILAFLSNGLISVNQKVYSMFTQKLQIFEFVAVAYITAAVLSFVILGFIMVKNKNVKHKHSRQLGLIVSGCLVGVLLGIFQCLNTYAASVIDGTILYSTYNCGVSLLSTITGRIFFKEKLSVKQYIGVLVGIISIALLCL